MSRCPVTPDWDPHANFDVEARAAEFATMRDQCPVAYGVEGWGAPHFWSVFRYGDIQSAVRDPKTFANGALARLGIRRAPLESDPPEHAQIRRLLNPLFSASAMAAREPITRTIATDYIVPFAENGGGDAVKMIGRPIPTQVLLTWLGQPREDWERIKDWADAARPQKVASQAVADSIHAAETALWDYSWAMVRDRQQTPRDPATDPVSAILAGTLDGEPMPEEHAVGMVRLVLAAGHDSTSQAMGIVLHFLATHPDIQAQLRADRAGLLPGIEEILRINSPVVAMPRSTTRDVAFQGRDIGQGDRVLLYWASANRDPDVFEAPTEWRPDRKGKPHMVFGSGIHTCAGAPLARQELVVMINLLFDHSRAVTLAGEPTVMKIQQYGFSALPLSVEPRT